jgi:hypothetical protein
MMQVDPAVVAVVFHLQVLVQSLSNTARWAFEHEAADNCLLLVPFDFIAHVNSLS